MLLKSVYFFFLINFVKSLCPNGTLEWQSNCFYFNANSTGFATAEIACTNLGSHLVSIHDAFTNVVLGEEAQQYFLGSTETNFWIGANNLMSHTNWSWTDESSFDFSDWKQGEPQNTTGLNCAALSVADGFWTAEDCFKVKPYVCKLANAVLPTNSQITTTITPPPPTYQPPRCPTSWNYFNYTGYCYGVLMSANNQNQMVAEKACNQEGAHLISIHSKIENDFIGNLPFGLGHTWIGLYTIDGNKEWLWTDETPYDYSNWNKGEPNNPEVENCVEINESSPFGFNNVPCDNLYPQFICKKLAT